MATPDLIAQILGFIGGALLVLIGIYAALAGAVAAVIGVPDSPLRLTRAVAAAVALAGLGAYLVGAALLAGFFPVLP